MGIGFVELLILVALVAGVVLVVTLVRIFGASSSAQLGATATPSMPAKREPARDPFAVVAIHPGAPLAEQLREHANAAELRGLRPFLEFGATWCPPSRMFGEVLGDPRMREALDGVYLIRAEMDDFNDDPGLREFGPTAVPVFFELNAEGRSTGRQINGGAWGADTVENMSRTMAGFFAA
jgi:thiol:disulfide interchange protein